MNIQIINPTLYPHWDDLLITNPETNFFHTAAWAKVLNESYGYTPLYFTLLGDGHLYGLIPTMEINSFLTGKRGVSLPFTDFCEPVAHDTDMFTRLFENVINYGRKADWQTFQIRGGKAFLGKELAVARMLVHTLSLCDNEDKVRRGFRESTNRNTRKAQRRGVVGNLEHSSTAMEDFYRLHCGTRRRHGLPPQPWSFFDNLFKFVVTAGKGFVAVAEHFGRKVAAAVFFHFQGRAIFKFGASDRKHFNLRPNNLVMWAAIQWACRSGLKTLSLGRTEPENEGLLQFKRGWGTEEQEIAYYTFDCKKNRFLNNDHRIKSSYRLFKILPLPVLRLTGDILYRHVG